MSGHSDAWIENAVIYQIYVRSFADSNGDGIGDLTGISSRLDYLDELGVDAIWLTPFFRSPMVDGGYDVADYRAVDPRFGTMADFDALLGNAHARGLRVIIDIVPNHTSDQHEWFQDALASEPGSAARRRYVFRSGRGPDGSLPPNNWESVFGGSAWTRLPDGDFYLHLFAPQQPDLDWENEEVHAEFVDILHFWLDKGVDGIRVDVAHGLVKPAGLPDADRPTLPGRRPYFDQEGVHDIYRDWRKVLGNYLPRRIMVAEARLRDITRTARYVRPDEMDQAFNFEFLWAPWSLPQVKAAVTGSLCAMAEVGTTPAWVIGNHDEIRVVNRLGTRDDAYTGDEWFAQRRSGGVTESGDRRARAMALLSMALPGAAYVYQGDELGLPEVWELPDEVREDPVWHRSNGASPGRDGCRVPMPWNGARPSFGFGPADGDAPWLPQPEQWHLYTVDAQRARPGSMLALYTEALRLRRELHMTDAGELTWLAAPEGVLAFRRAGGLGCAVNFSGEAVPLSRTGLQGTPILASAPSGSPDVLPAESAVWCR